MTRTKEAKDVNVMGTCIRSLFIGETSAKPFFVARASIMCIFVNVDIKLFGTDSLSLIDMLLIK